MFIFGCLITFFTYVNLAGCTTDKEPLFVLLSEEESGVGFRNEIIEDNELNIINLEFLYNGGGVGVGDFNNDGLDDLFFTGNIVENELYINKGDLRFDNISEDAGIGGNGKWKSGVALIDINNDELLDIYVCATIEKDSILRENMLFVNQGINSDGNPSFVDEAAAYGINDPSHSSNALFFDYDNDSDLDLFILVNTQDKGVPTNYRQKIVDGTSILTDRLYRNDGKGSFTNVSAEVGILVEGHGLGVSIIDINNDGWRDIYIANDFLTNDVLYVNHEGVFVDEIDRYFKHQSKFSMGTDAGDINNDGLIDLVTVDMMPEVNNRKKAVIQGGMYINYINDARFGYTHQYTRNMLQLNNGSGSFSEIGQFSGIHQTEWSWSPLLADFDNDGYKDLVITNGFPKDITDKDFMNFRQRVSRVASSSYLTAQMKSVKVNNYAFKNTGESRFDDVSEEWGFIHKTFSNGAAYADLDNDGDLDYIVNNINDRAFVYENTLNNAKNANNEANNFLRVKLRGSKENLLGLGSKLAIYYGANVQYHEHSVYRGYISTIESTIHFGLGDSEKVDSLVVIWPTGIRSKIKDIAVNQQVTIEMDEIGERNDNSSFNDFTNESQLLRKVNEKFEIDHVQQNYDLDDYSFQRTLPHKFSQFGPSIAVGDINSDQKEDFIVGSYENEGAQVFIQMPDGKFIKESLDSGSKEYVDGGLLLFDADNDNDLDLYMVSSGFRAEAESDNYMDRFYRNNDGNFERDPLAIPEIKSSGSVVRAADYDSDGDLDLFIGGRVIPHNYPLSPKNYLLENDNGKFKDVTMEYASGLSQLGMVTDAIFSDYDDDGELDLIVVGEMMAITIFSNLDGQFTKLASTGIENYFGLWNSISGGDFDNDGDLDYVAGNYGINNSYGVTKDRPLFVYATDIDKNGSIDPIIACHNKFDDGKYYLSPYNLWEELSGLSPIFRRRFESYDQYGRATIDSVLTKEEQEECLILKANQLASAYIENLGDGRFQMRDLPAEAQVAPVNGLLFDDLDNDQFLDIIMIGNDHGNEVGGGNQDAFNGLVLLGDGTGEFTPAKSKNAGLQVAGDGKSLVRLLDEKFELIIATQNKDSILVFEKINLSDAVISVDKLETSALLEFNNGVKRKLEFYYGSGYLSQSSRNISVERKAGQITFFQGNKETRVVRFE